MNAVSSLPPINPNNNYNTVHLNLINAEKSKEIQRGNINNYTNQHIDSNISKTKQKVHQNENNQPNSKVMENKDMIEAPDMIVKEKDSQKNLFDIIFFYLNIESELPKFMDMDYLEDFILLTKEDLSELKMAFDLFDPNNTGFVKVEEIIHAMDSMNFSQKNPILYQITCDLKKHGNDKVSWEQFAWTINDGVTNRNTEEGLQKVYNLIIDDPNVNVMDFEVFQKISKEVGANLNDDQIRHILSNTTENEIEISQNDFNRYMKK